MKKILSALLITVIMLTGCGEKAYEDEDAKLDAYVKETYFAFMHYSYKAGLNNNNGYELDEVLNIEPYIEAYGKDIDPDKLSTRARVFYEESLTELDSFDSMVDNAERNMPGFVKTHFNQNFGSDGFISKLRSYADTKHYEGEDYPEPVSVEELQKGNYTEE
ncbi:hypothetical protein [Abyssicoccus albus]|uniref:Uncharacterized protein n=1 Tax=Abyssicoccus albus TaxID=1817405 RepID=A0A3N5BCP1_9BACL|nr:hypothetical protein [Abyssicoccus albus]RPF54779.1 hypothetical protein EDD62_1740 [Abyssicoccus albus]